MKNLLSLLKKAGKLRNFMKMWFTPAEIMVLVTSNNARLLDLAGPRHPYQQGPLGVIAPGAYADLILVEAPPQDGAWLGVNDRLRRAAHGSTGIVHGLLNRDAGV